jgi:hypothetical protein
MNNPRDITTVINQILAVVPLCESETSHSLIDFRDNTIPYQPPEYQQKCWYELMIILNDNLGNPTGIPWKEQVSQIMMGK